MSESNTCADNIIQIVQRDQLPCLQIRHPLASALIALQGAQVLEYTPAGAKPVIWLSETAGFQRGQSVRGGIPVCWPWFGDLRRNPASVQASIGQDQAPAHGWVRNLPWLLEQAETNDNGVNIRLRYPLPSGVPTDWAPNVELVLSIHIGHELVLQLDTTNHNQQALSLSQALHSYFAVSHIDRVRVQSLQNVRYIDTLRDWHAFSDNDSLVFQGETDRIYLDTPPLITLEDTGWQRNIHIHCADSRSAVVWNPWIEKAQRLSHFADDAYQRMLCIETARVMDDHITLLSGQTDRMTLRIWQSPI